MSYKNQGKLSARNLAGSISELYVFGDLLSDTGNLFTITSLFSKPERLKLPVIYTKSAKAD